MLSSEIIFNSKRNDLNHNSQAPDGESQPSTEVDLFVSVEKIMVLNTNLQVLFMWGCSWLFIVFIIFIDNLLFDILLIFAWQFIIYMTFQYLQNNIIKVI